MYKATIYVVEPDEQEREILRKFLAGKFSNVQSFVSFEDSFSAFRNERPHALILTNTDLTRERDYIHLQIVKLTPDSRGTQLIWVDRPKIEIIGIVDLVIDDDYLFKPLDFEVLTEIILTNGEIWLLNDFQPLTKLPMGKRIENYLRELLTVTRKWTLFDIGIRNLDAFAEVYSWYAGDEVLLSTAEVLKEIVADSGMESDFIAHPEKDNFILVTYAEDSQALIDRLCERFAKEIQSHYSFIDRERGYMLIGDEQVELMSLSFGMVSSEQNITDIRELTATARADRRRRDSE